MDMFGLSSVFGVGFPKGSNCFRRKNLARKREKQPCQRLAQEDEMGVFQICVPKELAILS